MNIVMLLIMLLKLEKPWRIPYFSHIINAYTT